MTLNRSKMEINFGRWIANFTNDFCLFGTFVEILVSAYITFRIFVGLKNFPKGSDKMPKINPHPSKSRNSVIWFKNSCFVVIFHKTIGFFPLTFANAFEKFTIVT